MTAPVVLSAEAHAILAEKARAWDAHVKHRFLEGFARAEQFIELFQARENLAQIILSDALVITPFGNVQTHNFEDKKTIYDLTPTSRIRINQEVQFKIS